MLLESLLELRLLTARAQLRPAQPLLELGDLVRVRVRLRVRVRVRVRVS